MSHFSSVDDSPDPAALVASLDRSAVWLGAMKAYIAAAASLAVPGGRVLDLGCGIGHDLALLATAGVRPVGLDPSAVMVAEAARRLGPGARVVQGVGRSLPFAAGSFDGCRIERVLQHVEDPELVLAETARVVRPRGFLAVFEPDWTSWRADTELAGAEAFAAELSRPRQPDIGGRLPDLVERAGFQVRDVVTEASVINRIADMPIGLEVGLERAVGDGRIAPARAARWLEEQYDRDAAGTFRLCQTKVLVVARRSGLAGAEP
jgi:ubiquinone/menaquinone biosynthesis C-methylase UbiE